jgi:hypothetical protein
MGLPDITARVSVPFEKGEDNPYERFRALVLDGMDVYQRYTITKGGPEGGYFDRHGAFVQESTPHIEHIHSYDTEKGKTGGLLASIREEDRFGRRFYVMEIYDRKFADFVQERWGHVENVPERERRGNESPGHSRPRR